MSVIVVFLRPLGLRLGAAMTKADLIEKVQASHGDLSKRQVALVVDAVFDHLAKGIRKDKRFSMQVGS